MNEDEAFDLTFRTSYGAVLRYCLRRVPAAAANDATAEVFAIAWRRRSRIPGNPTPWLLAVARRVLANQSRSQRRRARLIGRLGASRDERDAEAMSPVEAAIGRLSLTDGEVVRLAYWDELTHQEIGEVLGMSANAVGVRLHRARARLRTELTSEHEEETAPCESPN